MLSNKSSIYYITGEQNASTRMEDSDLHATYITTISFDHTNFNSTIPVEDNQVTGNQDKVVISGKIPMLRIIVALFNRKIPNILCKF